MNVSIIIPTIRLESAKRCIELIKKNAGVDKQQYEIVQGIDPEGVGCPEMVKRLTQRTKYDWVMFLGDDTEPQPGFLKAALDQAGNLPDGWGVIGLNTEGGNKVAHWLAHKKMLSHIPGGNFFSTEYAHAWCDNELMDIASELGQWIFCDDAIIKHNHPIVGKGEWDTGYQKAYTDENQKNDYRTYLYRRRERLSKPYGGTRLAVGIPLTDLKVYSHFMFSFLTLDRNYSDILMPNFPGQIDAIRNDLVQQALKMGCTHILMMDTDQIYQDADMIERMLSHDLPVVGAKVHRRYPPFDPLLLRGKTGKLYSVSDEEIDKGGLIEVDATGCGCILYNTEVFIELPEPWFEIKKGDFGQTVGEDIGFCEKLKKAGYRIFVDCDIDIKHLTLLAVDMATHKLYKKLKGVK